MKLEAKRSLSWMLLTAAYLIFGIATEFARTYHWADYYQIIFVVVALTLFFSWYYFDSLIVGYPRTKLLNFLVLALTLIGIPGYLFASRGPKKGFIGTGIFLGFLFATFILSWFGAILGYIALRFYYGK
ncbi:MAG TPA: hypothetical protein VGO35_02050 [Gammaproteobacteria bacterium]|nr:hypothetical protein [Gammaproteobacteria bacterium]